MHPLTSVCFLSIPWFNVVLNTGSGKGGGEGRRGGKRGGVVEAVLKGEKLFLSINKEIRLKYSNHLNIFAGDVTYGVS